MDLRSTGEAALRSLAAALVSLILLSAAVVSAALPVWLATPFLTGALGMQPQPAILLAASLEVMIGVLTIKSWHMQVDKHLLGRERTHCQSPFPFRAASTTAILASFLLGFFGALTLFRDRVHAVIALLAEVGMPAIHAPHGLGIMTVLTAALARIAAYAAITLAYPRLMQLYERSLRRSLAQRDHGVLTDEALEVHRAFLHRTNLQAREVATAHRTALLERS